MANQLSWQAAATIPLLTTALAAQQVCLGTSDTVLGLLAPVTSEGARALDRIKKRGKKPYIVLIDHQDKLTNFVQVQWTAALTRLVDHCWPGPLTLIFKLKPDPAQAFLQQQGTTLAVRVPDHAGLRQLLPHFPGLFSTSANLAGQAVPTQLDQVAPEILAKVAYIVLDDLTTPAVNLGVYGSLPSTILDCSALAEPGGKIKVVRAGAYEVPVLEQIYGERFACPAPR